MTDTVTTIETLTIEVDVDDELDFGSLSLTAQPSYYVPATKMVIEKKLSPSDEVFEPLNN